MRQKSLFILLCLAALTLPLTAQVKQERRVYYLDVTGSMEDPNGIWNDVRNDLIDAIDDIDDEDTEIIVIPFATNVQGAHTAKATRDGKKDLAAFIKNLKPDYKAYTNLNNPIQDFYQHRIAPKKINYFFLITDGTCYSKTTNTFHQLLQSWNNQTQRNGKDVFGFYVMLNDKATDQQAIDIIDRQTRLQHVKTANINIQIIQLDDKAVYNLKDNNLCRFRINNGVKQAKKLRLTSNDTYYEIDSYEVEGDFIELQLKPHTTNPPREHKMSVQVSYTGSKKETTIVATPTLSITCRNLEERTFTWESDVKRKLKCTEHASFLWSKAHNDTITETIRFAFNEGAQKQKGSLTLQLRGYDKKDKPIRNIHFLDASGKAITSLQLNADETSREIRITFPKNASKGKYYVKLVADGQRLDRIGNSDHTSGVELATWTVRYGHKMNPLAKGLLWLAIIVVSALLIYRCCIVPALYPRFGNIQKTILVNGDYRKALKFRGKRLVVLTPQSRRQSLWNKFWTGTILYYTIPELPGEIQLRPRGKRKKVQAAIYAPKATEIQPHIVETYGEATIKMENVTIKLQ